DAVLSGRSTLSLLTATLQQLNHVFELHLGPWGPGQTGFVALPSHPADSPVILQLQFLFDVLQKTLSLKVLGWEWGRIYKKPERAVEAGLGLVHVPGLGLPGPIKIFPFKSLRQLELRGVPLHCLHGLRAIYSQLETLICSRSLQALEELLSACGGDLCSALPWLALLSADFSYNTLTALDSSLRLLSALRFLNLSHNQFLLDGKALSLTDFQTSPSSGLGPMAPPLPWPVGSTTETSGGPDLSDSPSSGGVVAQPPLRKVKSRVRVRRASISEPRRFVQQHRELELMNSFRDRFGRDWLQYRNHLEASGPAALGTRPPDAPSPEAVRGPPPPEKGSAQEEAEAVRVEPEPQEEEELEEGEEEGGKEEEEEEQSELEVELCRPMLVCPLEGPGGLRGRECFLWVTAGHLFELRRYVVLEPDAQAAVQELLAVLSPAATLGKHQLGEARDPPGGRLQCLRCGHEFKPEEPRSGLDESPAVCPNCGSDHVVLLSPGTPSGEQGQGEQSPAPSQSPSPGHSPPGHSAYSTRAGSAPSQAPASRDRHSWSLSPPPERCGLRSVDHRLRLFLDVEVFTDAQEEFQCCLKDLSSIELGLAGQSLRLEWAAGAGGCVLLPRDARHCRAFLEELTVSAPHPEEQRQRHGGGGDPEASALPLRFFYLRAFLVEGPSTCPVSLLLTLSTLYLLDEDPIGSQAEPPLAAASGEASEKAPAPGPGPSVSRLESFWALHVVCLEQLTALLAWIREPWEELFSIGLRTVTQEALDLD
ncbi:hypothetical protein E2I00_003117, partial [Balaenoptera physalus]